jgi:hypothetical protein
MKNWTLVGLSALLLVVTGWAVERGTAPDTAKTETAPPAAADPPPLIVHEWGTFTSFSGSDGVKLEFRPLEERDLPAFVFDRFRQSKFSLTKYSIPAIQRMETPITYFYTPVERDVTVRVAFPKGLLTEFYPPVRSLGPKMADSDDVAVLFGTRPKEDPTLKASWLDWGRVHLIPTESLKSSVQDAELARRIGRHVERTMVPDAGNYRHYAAARDTDSAIVQVRHLPQSGNSVPVADYFEKFLFYRGLGNFDLPLTLTATTSGFQLVNSAKEAIQSLILVSVHNNQIRFGSYAQIDAGGTLDLKLPEQQASKDQLRNVVVMSLVAQGLYDKEAQAMFETWETSWFGEEGTRLFYLVPQRMTDELLPLEIVPRPTEQVRVLVGRMEIMSPAEETNVLALDEKSLTARENRPNDASSSVLPELVKLGRLGEPALVRARHLAAGDELKQEAQRLIAELRDKRSQQP